MTFHFFLLLIKIHLKRKETFGANAKEKSSEPPAAVTRSRAGRKAAALSLSPFPSPILMSTQSDAQMFSCFSCVFWKDSHFKLSSKGSAVVQNTDRHSSRRPVSQQGLAGRQCELHRFPNPPSRELLGSSRRTSVYGFWVSSPLLGIYPKDLTDYLDENESIIWCLIFAFLIFTNNFPFPPSDYNAHDSFENLLV